MGVAGKPPSRSTAESELKPCRFNKYQNIKNHLPMETNKLKKVGEACTCYTHRIELKCNSLMTLEQLANIMIWQSREQRWRGVTLKLDCKGIRDTQGTVIRSWRLFLQFPGRRAIWNYGTENHNGTWSSALFIPPFNIYLLWDCCVENADQVRETQLVSPKRKNIER